MARTPWKLTDNSTGSAVVLSFTINPKEATYPGREATIGEELTTAPGGQVILFQGRDKVRKMTFAGSVMSQTWYNGLDTWKDKWYPLVLEDDLGKVWTVLITKWEWTRIRRAGATYRFDFKATVRVVSG